MKDVLDKMAIARRVPVLEISIPNACAVLVNGAPVVYVSPTWLERQTAGEYLGKVLILAHELGHHVNFHNPPNDGLQPWQREAAADRFAGSVLRRFGATKEEIYSLVEKIFPLEGTVTHPDRAIRYISLLNGFTGRWDGLSSSTNDGDGDGDTNTSISSSNRLNDYVENIIAIEQRDDDGQMTLLGGFMEAAGIQSLRPAELLVSGARNSIQENNCFQLNTLPAIEFWPNLITLALIVDQLSERLASRVIITSGYRSPAYNSCISGSPLSTHNRGEALDVTAVDRNPQEVLRVLCQLRSEGTFSGGIGVYATHVHFDIRGSNVNWGEQDCENIQPSDEFSQLLAKIEEYVEGYTVDSNLRTRSYDVVLQAGHVGREHGAVGTIGNYLTEKNLNLYLAGKIKDYLLERGIPTAVVGAEGFEQESPIETKIFLALHADAAEKSCSIGPSYSARHSYSESAMAAIAAGLGSALGYEPNDFFTNNFTDHLSNYYAYKFFDASLVEGVLEIGELTCLEQEENILRNLDNLVSNLGASIDFQLATQLSVE